MNIVLAENIEFCVFCGAIANFICTSLKDSAVHSITIFSEAILNVANRAG